MNGWRPCDSHFDDATNVLTIRNDGEVAASGNLETAEGRAAIERFFTENFQPELKGPPKVLSGAATAFRMSPARSSPSSISTASARSRTWSAAPVHPLRFRANLYVKGWPAWSEFDLLDQTLAIGDVRLKVVKRIVRCAAVNVDPDTAAARPRDPADAPAPARPHAIAASMPR